MTSIVTFAATHTPVAMLLAIMLYLWIAVGNWYMGDRFLAGVWASYAFSNLFFIGDWAVKRGVL